MLRLGNRRARANPTTFAQVIIFSNTFDLIPIIELGVSEGQTRRLRIDLTRPDVGYDFCVAFGINRAQMNLVRSFNACRQLITPR